MFSFTGLGYCPWEKVNSAYGSDLEPMTTPTCPACEAKFSHNRQTLVCNKCGLPDEIKDAGPAAINIWKKGKLPYASQQPQVDFTEKRGARRNHRAKRHGQRKGRGSVSQATPRPRYRRRKDAA